MCDHDQQNNLEAKLVSYSSEASSWAAVTELIYQSGHSKNLADIF